MKTFLRLAVALVVLGLFALTVEVVRVRSIREGDCAALRVGSEDVVRRVKATTANLATVMDMNSRDALAKARAFARIIDKDPSLVDDQERFAALCKPLDVEELHVSDEKGILVRSVPAAYCGYDMNSADQSRPFMKAISDKSFELVQEPTLKGADGTLFQYAGVARLDKPGILQVGWSADRVREARRLADVGAIAESTRVGRNGRVKIMQRAATDVDDSGFRKQVVDGRRIYLLVSNVDAYRIEVTIPVAGTWLSDNMPFAVLCVLDLVVVLLLILLQLGSVKGVLQRNVRSLSVLFGGLPEAQVSSTDGKAGIWRRLYSPAALACEAAFLGVAALCWFFSAKSAMSDAQELLLTAAAEMRGQIDTCVDQQLFYQAHSICRSYRTPSAMPSEIVRRVAERLGLDEMNVIDDRGVIVASSIAGQIGYDMKDNPNSREFNCLLEGEAIFEQPFRKSANSEMRYKYVGVAFPPPVKGYLQIGFSENRLKDQFDYWFASAARGRYVGRSGFFLIAKDETGDVDSCGKIDELGREAFGKGDTLASVGFDISVAPKAADEFFRATLYGEPCLCLSEVRNFHRCITALPLDEISKEAKGSALAVIAVLFGVFLVVGVFMTRLSDLVTSLKRYISDAARRQAEDMVMAKNIQTNVLPNHFPPYPQMIDRLDIFARMLTAREVGGDFYDFYFVSSGKLALVIADVSGKGVPAALFMMRAKATLQGMLKSGMDIADAVKEANNRLCEGNDANMFVTAWVCVVNMTTGDAEFVNAGHNPPVLKRRDCSVNYLTEKSGPPLAAMPGVAYHKKVMHIDRGDGLLLYTDGVTEATNPKLELFGEKRLVGTMRGLLGAHDAQAIVDGIVDSVRNFADGAEQADDITLLAFKLK